MEPAGSAGLYRAQRSAVERLCKLFKEELLSIAMLAPPRIFGLEPALSSSSKTIFTTSPIPTEVLRCVHAPPGLGVF